MRPLLLLAALLLAAAPATAQPPVEGTATLTLSGLPERVVANGTQHSQEVELLYEVDQGTCAGGSQPVTVTLAAEAEGATVEVQPRTFQLNVGTTETSDSGASFPMTATIVVTAGAVQEETEVPVNVTATSSEMTCTVAVFGGAAAQTASGSYVAEFYPIQGVNQNTTTEEPVPGFEVPVLLAAMFAGLMVLRRRKA